MTRYPTIALTPEQQAILARQDEIMRDAETALRELTEDLARDLVRTAAEETLHAEPYIGGGALFGVALGVLATQGSTPGGVVAGAVVGGALGALGGAVLENAVRQRPRALHR